MRNAARLPRLLVLTAAAAGVIAFSSAPAGADGGGAPGAANPPATPPANEGADALRFFESRLAAVSKSCADKLWEAASNAKSQGFHQFALETADVLVSDWSPDHADARELMGFMKKGKEWVADPKANVAKQNSKNEKESQKSFDDRAKKWRELRGKVTGFIAAKLAVVGDECAAKGYPEQAAKAAERALSLDKDCAGARKILGYERFGTLWVTKAKADAIKRAVEGKWVDGTSDIEKSLGGTFSKIESTHFRIEDEGPKEALPEAIRALETLYAYYLADIGRDPTEDVFGGKAATMCVVSTKARWDKWVDDFSGAADKKWTKESNTYRSLTMLRSGTLRVETAESIDTRDPLLHHAAHLLNHFVWRASRTAWIDEGLAYYYTVKVQETTRTSCLAKGTEGGYAEEKVVGGEKDWSVSERWKSYLRPFVAKKNDPELRKIMGTPLATLDLPASVKAWGVLSYLMDTRREKVIEFLKRMRDRKDPAKELQEDVFQSVFATSIEAIDTEWRAFALRAY